VIELSATVVVPVYNGAATIDHLLSALLGQTGRPRDVEIIVVDNGSADGTPENVRAHPVTLLHEPRRGPAAARNRGLRAARGDVVVHLDADTLPTRRWLADMISPFTSPAVMLVGGRTLGFRPQNAVERYFTRIPLYDAVSTLKRPVFPFVQSANMAVRRSAALAIGGWDDDMLTAEDIDFCYRLLLRCPGSIVYQPRAILFHRNRTTVESMCRQAWTYGEGAGKLYQKYPHVVAWSWRQGLRLRWVLVARWLGAIGVRSKHRLGLASREAVEFAECHRLWTTSFWRGFLSFRRQGDFVVASTRPR